MSALTLGTKTAAPANLTLANKSRSGGLVTSFTVAPTARGFSVRFNSRFRPHPTS